MRYLPPLAALLLAAAPASADDVRDLVVRTGRTSSQAFALAGKDDSQQLVVTGKADGRDVDLTRAAAYESSPAGVVAIDKAGLVTPLKDGKATITAKAGGRAAAVEVEVGRFDADVPVNFVNEIVPIFTKFTCNGGGCHGKSGGQNGFRLSLLGFEPEEDFEYLIKEARGRRLLPSAPEHSLLVRKATGQTAHGGGKKLDPESPFYRLLVRWIAQGAPYGKKTDPTVSRIEVLPRDAVVARGAAQQVAVVAHLSDGSTRDVTRMTQLEVNQPEMAEVSPTGLVSVNRIPGMVTVMARFQTHVDVFRAAVPLGEKTDRMPRANNFIDSVVFAQLRALGLPPSERCDDNTFVRRVTIDLCGRLPSVREANDFAADKDARKDAKLVERLLASEDHADYFTNKWSAVLRNRRASPTDNPQPTKAFHSWIRESVKTNKPYDKFVREIITAKGEEVATPPVVWYRELKGASELVEDASQLFLGQRIGCAKCHHHPFEKWSQEDYYGMTAFFSTVDVKIPPPPKGKNNKKKDDKTEEPLKVASVSLKKNVASAINPRTNKAVRPTGLGGKAFDVGRDEDPREKLAEWMTAKENPYFARTLVNRYWKHFMGRGLVDPEDDMRVTNPASNPELLDALAKSFVESGYDVRKLVEAICNSATYRLSAVPNAHNASDKQNYSRFVPRRLNAEVLLDAIDAVTASKTAFKGAPAGTRAVQLQDNQFDSYFLSVFGRPDAASACECERSSESSLAQCLHMLNSQEILNKASGQRAKDAAKDKRPHAERIEELYLIALSRKPSKEETAALVAHVEKKGATGYEDVIWVLINTKEFTFNH